MDSLPLNSLTIAITGASKIVSTFLSHYSQRKRQAKDSEGRARDDLLFDEAFSVVKHFFEKASLHTVEELQAFGNNWTPAPPNVRVNKAVIPVSTRLEAGRIIIATLGEKEVDDILGGREWWQRTANKEGGVRGEWISMKKHWQGLDADEVDGDMKEKEHKKRARQKQKEVVKKGKENEKEWEREQRKSQHEGAPAPETSVHTAEEDVVDEPYTPELDEMRCMMYIHGGGGFFGSINTHRYALWRLARKTSGRVFAVSYRLAPQYPFPCALSDVLASYLYLIRPPPGAKHRPVDPSKLTLAGDSAGGGLCLALLCLIRDAGLPAPAGGILISPWCDLTHSFPSCMENTATDVIPPYGFLFKPSTLWPPPPAQFQTRANESTSMPSLKARYLAKRAAKAHRGHKDEPSTSTEESTAPEAKAKPELREGLKMVIDGEEVEIRDQIQLYATNEQLAYPFVSPVWMPSLGGLPPLYILAGDNEVLRDEIIYMAHRAADPSSYPIRQGLLDVNPERAAKSLTYEPTQVHLQIYDDCPHDLPLFSFTTPAKFAYRAMASFANFVTTSDELPTPTDTPTNVSSAKVIYDEPEHETLSDPSPEAVSAPLSKSASSSSQGRIRSRTNSLLNRGLSLLRTSSREGTQAPGLDSTIYSSTTPLSRPPFVSNMVRERVSITGVVRSMEPIEELRVLKLNKDDLGTLTPAPVKRYLAGKKLWDARFKKTYENVQKRREYHLQRSIREESSRIQNRFKSRNSPSKSSDSPSTTTKDAIEGIWELHGERPPPSSIAARKDTSEARKLAHVLDTHYSKIHALHLWKEVDSALARIPTRKDSQ